MRYSLILEIRDATLMTHLDPKILCMRTPNTQLYWPVEVQQALPALGLEVFDVLRLVEDQVPPRLASEGLMILQHQLVWSDAHVESIRLRPALREKKKQQAINMVQICDFRETSCTTTITESKVERKGCIKLIISHLGNIRTANNNCSSEMLLIIENT